MKKTVALLLTILMFAALPGTALAGGGADDSEPVSGTPDSTGEVLDTPVYNESWSEDSLRGVEEVVAAPDFNLPVKAAVLMERHTGRVLYNQNGDEGLALASITKVMSLLIVMEAVEQGKMTRSDTVVTSEHAAGMGGSQIWLEPGEEMTVDDLLKAVCIGSANDATVALAEHVAGSEDAFVALMNERAAQLGMTHTHFVNASGLDAEGHYASAIDIAVMSRELMKHPIIFQYCMIWMDSLRGGATQLVNTNKLVRFYPGVTGLKTGTTNEAGNCISATAARDGLEIIAVVMGATSGDARFTAAKTLLNYGFSNYEVTSPALDLSGAATVRVAKGVDLFVPVVPDPETPQLVAKGRAKDVQVSIELQLDLTAPVGRGQQVGRAVYTLDGAEIGELPLRAEAAVERITLGGALCRLGETLLGRPE